MIIKSADDKNSCISTLQELLAHPDAAWDIKKRIEQEIRNIRAGLKGEQESAYEIDFHYGTSKNWMIIHDLRIECEGRVAQIDHLIMNRFLEIWVCESKHFSEGIAINEHGECTAFYDSKPYGVPSPIEQNRKHMAVLESAFKTGLVNLPTRLGFSITPTINSLVLVSKGARITRPKAKIDGLDSIIKNDQFKTRIDKAIDGDNNPLVIAKLIGSDTLEDFARRLTAVHKPIEFNWHAKFGLQKDSPKSKHIFSSMPVEDVNNIAEVNSKPMAVARQGEPAYETKEASVSISIAEGAPCPRCGTGKLVRKPGKNGKSDFFACSNFAKTKCRFTESII